MKGGTQMKYIGIIDSLGVESFVLKGSTGFPFKVRAYANKASRNAEAYEVEVTEWEILKIKDLIHNLKYEIAGEMIKSNPSYKSIM
jgi:hypothetical protein